MKSNPKTNPKQKLTTQTYQLILLVGLLLIPFAIYACQQNNLSTIAILLYGLLIADIAAIGWM